MKNKFTTIIESLVNDNTIEYPTKEGYWWMNDTHAYGWEPVWVVKEHKLDKEFRVMRPGVEGNSKIEPWIKEWLYLEKPN